MEPSLDGRRQFHGGSELEAGVAGIFRRRTAILVLSALSAWLTLSGPVEAAKPEPSGSEVPVYLPPTGLWLAPSDFGKALYGPTGPRANWHAAQWDIEEDLPAFDRNGVSRNQYASVRWLGDKRYELSQDSSRISCERTYPSGRAAVNEVDLLITPNNTYYSSYPQTTAKDTQDNIAELSQLNAGITLKIEQAAASDLVCKVSYTTFMYAVVLSNYARGQTLFYQLHLGQFAGERDGIKVGTMRPHWFFNGSNVQTAVSGQWGFADCITSFGQEWAQLGTLRTYRLDLLPRLLWVIEQGSQHGLDQDLTHWHLAGTYHGQNTMGHVRNDAVWSDFSLKVSTQREATSPDAKRF